MKTCKNKGKKDTDQLQCGHSRLYFCIFQERQLDKEWAVTHMNKQYLYRSLLTIFRAQHEPDLGQTVLFEK